MAMTPYRKKPVIIKAEQMETEFEVETLEGRMRGKAGDYLIEGVEGELYPCDSRIFEKTYEAVNDGDYQDHMRHKKGMFEVSSDLVYSNSPAMAELFSQVKVIDATEDMAGGYVRYVGICEKFDYVPEGEEVPFYSVAISDSEGVSFDRHNF